MEPEPVVEPTPAPASERPVRAAAQKAAQKREEEAEAAAKKKAASGKATAAALQKKLAAQKEAASAVEAAQKARIEELEAGRSNITTRWVGGRRVALWELKPDAEELCMLGARRWTERCWGG